MAKTLLPAQDSNTNGKLLKSNGTDASWEEAGLNATDIVYADTNSNLDDATDVQTALDNAGAQLASHLAESASVAHGDPPMAKIYNNLNQSIPNVTWSTLGFNSEIIDNDGFHDNSTNNSRLTIPRAGVYLFIANIVYGNSATGKRSGRAYKNGVNSGVNILSQSAINSAMTYQFSSIVGLEVFNEGDYIELEVYQASGSSLDVLTGETNFSIIKVG